MSAKFENLTVHFEPRVYLVAGPVIYMGSMEAILRNEFGGADWQRDGDGMPGELLCEFMGRMCYGSFGDKQGRKSTRTYLENVMNSGHGSVLEHANYSFLVTRCSRGFTHQMVRHRAGFAYSQESTHFIKYDEGAEVCLPGMEAVFEQHTVDFQALIISLKAYVDVCELIQGEVFQNMSKGRKKAICGTARNLLPTAIQSRLGMTGNIRSLRHFIELRGEECNVPEIRMVANGVLCQMLMYAPTCFCEYESYVAEDGFVAIRSTVPTRRKV